MDGLKAFLRFCAAAPLALAILAACSASSQEPARTAAMPAFTSDKQVGDLIKRMQARAERRRKDAVLDGLMPPPPPPAPAEAAADAAAAPEPESSQITNVQEQGVDEGGIVKNHGSQLVILRRGRLFTVDVSGETPRAIDMINAYPPDETMAGGAWYDEMLVAKDVVVVIGYSYAYFGTEVNRFRISAEGKLAFLDSYRIRSADYYSSRNYASRLIGSRLVLYQPLPMWLGQSDWREALPGIKRWEGPTGNDRDNKGFTRLAPVGRIYAARPLLSSREAMVDTFHSVTSCDLTAPRLDCSATVVLGSSSRSFYVSNDAVYVWTSNTGYGRSRLVSYLYRMPLDGSPPRAIGVRGGPIDQFSFREDKQPGVINVLVRDVSGGDSMWRSEFGDGGTALLRIPIAEFGDGSHNAARALYRKLPGEGYWAQNRYVGGHLLYAIGGYGDSSAQTLYAVPLDGRKLRQIALPHSISRLDAIGSDGVAIGVNKDQALGFSAIRLDPASGDAALEDSYFFANASEGENRSQAFFYRPDPADRSGTSGTMALPVSRRLSGSGAEFLGSAAAIVFLNRIQRKLSPAGHLDADTASAVNDNCVASCVDWYGNARPIFLRGRIFALMGYELVEGQMAGGAIREVRRLNFAPDRK
jgi:hypothetical protein